MGHTGAFWGLLIIICCCTRVAAQRALVVKGADSLAHGLDPQQFQALGRQAEGLQGKLQRQQARYLKKLQKQEARLYKKLLAKDSLLAVKLFKGVDDRYRALQGAPAAISAKTSVYSSKLDSLTTSLNFLSTQGAAVPGMEGALAKYKGLQGELDKAEAIKSYVAARSRQLKESLSGLGMVKELKGFQKQGYYYAAGLKELKALWEDPSKIEEKIISLAANLPGFRDYFRSNSALGSRYALPGGSISLQGLQTRASITQSLQSRFGSNTTINGLVQKNLRGAQNGLSALKSKLGNYGSGSIGEAGELPEGFKPNTQKTKSFWQRLEWGTNLQSQSAWNYFPVTTDLGLSLGYKLNDKSIIGLGASYKLGWGKNWDHIKITHQGVSLRSFFDCKLKGSLFVSGGYEQNYRTEFKNLSQLKDYTAWQSSGLVGISKKYKLSGKLKGEIKLLWDFLSYQQIPQTQPLLFRIGYSLK